LVAGDLPGGAVSGRVLRPSLLAAAAAVNQTIARRRCEEKRSAGQEVTAAAAAAATATATAAARNRDARENRCRESSPHLLYYARPASAVGYIYCG